jgi:hypothetical protein
MDAIKAGPNPNNNDVTGICTFGCPGMSESDYLSIVIEPRARQNMVTAKIATTIITDVEQIHAQQIITTSQAAANTIRQALDKGADFSDEANKQSSDQISNIASGLPGNGGDLGWFPKDTNIVSNVPQEVMNAAWPLKDGEYSQPVQSGSNWYIIKVLERNAHMPLTQDQITTKKTKLYNDWFNKVWAASQISPASAQAPTPTAPLLVEPTLLPGSSATPGASSPITGTTSPATGTITSTTTTTTPNTTGAIATTSTGSTPTPQAASPPATEASPPTTPAATGNKPAATASP